MTLRPNRCFSCGKPLHEKYNLFSLLTEDDGFSDADALSELELPRKCCTRMVLTGVEIQHFEGERLSYETTSKFQQPAAKSKELTQKVEKRVPIIPHLGNYEPTGRFLAFNRDTMVLSDETPLRQDEPDDLPNPIEWEERSRILAFLHFVTLTLKTSSATRVMYLGCGGLTGDSIKFVIDRFPEHEFVLIDWDGVTSSLKKLAKMQKYKDRLVVEQRKFTTTDAKELHGDVDALYCEYGLAVTGNVQYEQLVEQDMKLQAEWCKVMLPMMAMLKFRIPRIQGSFPYIDGELFLVPWASPRNLDAYLVLETLNEIKYINYDYQTHRQRMSYHNRHSRLSAWQHPAIKEERGIDACWDCAAETYILESHVKTVNPNRIGPNIINEVRDLTGQLSLVLDDSGTYTLNTPPRPEEEDEDLEEGVRNVK